MTIVEVDPVPSGSRNDSFNLPIILLVDISDDNVLAQQQQQQQRQGQVNTQSDRFSMEDVFQLSYSGLRGIQREPYRCNQKATLRLGTIQELFEAYLIAP